MSGFYFGNGNGYSYAIKKSDETIMEFVNDAEAQEYFQNDEENKKDSDNQA